MARKKAIVELQAEAKQLLHLVVHSVYSNKAIQT
jgi:HSP90 family molecular chaperone